MRAARVRVRVRSGWWHFAAALSPSLTAQRNFYSAESNTAGLVQLVTAKLRAAVQQQQQQRQRARALP